MQITGTLKVKKDLQQITDKFAKREFVVEVMDNPQYPQLVILQFVNDKCSLLDNYQIGDSVEVEFNLRGREWISPQGETKYFNTLDAWKIFKHGGQQQPTPSNANTGMPVAEEDLPF